MHTDKPDYRKDIFRLWISWVVSRGLLSLLVLLSLWMRMIYLPIFAFAFQILMICNIRRNREQNHASCYILPYIMSRVFFWTGVILVVISILQSTGVINLMFDIKDTYHEIPFLTVLIANPVCAIISAYGYINRRRLSFCRECELRHGSPAERGLLGLILAQIGHFQIMLLFWVSFSISAVGWLYYLLVFQSDFFSVPDRFVFFLLPTMVWIATTIYLALRYIGIYAYYKENVIDRVQYRENTSEIRFLVINGDRIAIKEPSMNTDFQISMDEKCDTAVRANIHRYQNMSTDIASEYFTNLTGVKGVDIRPMFVTELPLTKNHIFHYFALLSDEQRTEFDNLHPETHWLTLHELAPMLNSGMFAPMLAAEIVRFHTISSAFKTYDNRGHRRYKIKDYRPAVRFSDAASIDVDFNDTTWLYIANNNQDTPFHRIRHLYRKFFIGLDD